MSNRLAAKPLAQAHTSTGYNESAFGALRGAVAILDGLNLETENILYEQHATQVQQALYHQASNALINYVTGSHCVTRPRRKGHELLRLDPQTRL